LHHDPSTDKRAIKPLNVCRKMYGNILDSINKTLEILPQQNFVDAHNYMFSVLSYKSACQDSWKLSHLGGKRPWDVKTLTQSTAICVDILYYIVNNHKI
jgi:pectinesterase inhibitor-like protein